MAAEVLTTLEIMTFCVFQSCDTVPRGDRLDVNSILK
jgi:hypothetical protein